MALWLKFSFGLILFWSSTHDNQKLPEKPNKNFGQVSHTKSIICLYKVKSYFSNLDVGDKY